MFVAIKSSTVSQGAPRRRPAALPRVRGGVQLERQPCASAAAPSVQSAGRGVDGNEAEPTDRQRRPASFPQRRLRPIDEVGCWIRHLLFLGTDASRRAVVDVIHSISLCLLVAVAKEHLLH